MILKCLTWFRKNKFYIAKISLSIIIIILSILSNYYQIPNIYANYPLEQNVIQQRFENYQYDKATINNFILLSKAYDWSIASDLIKKGETFLVIDVETGKSINMQRTGGHRHYDVETISTKDTEILKDMAKRV